MSLVEGGRPLRALRALATVDAVDVDGLVTLAAQDEGERPGVDGSHPWADVLRDLVRRGLVVRSGDRFRISELGQRELFGEGSGQAPPESEAA